jgi:Gas vesicle synthesis protein GvpO
VSADGAAKRAEARERRRAGARDRQNATGDGDRQSGAGMHAARNAAAAAAVGAAVGAARALAARGVGADADHEEEPMPAQTESAVEETVEQEEPSPPAPERPQARRPEGVAPQRVRSIAHKAREQLAELQGSEPESLTALERCGDGWRATFEVVEVRRVPDSTDVLATYVVELDDDGDLVRYERLRRYYRAQADLGDDQ